MRLSELRTSDKLRLEININNENLEFDSAVAVQTNHYILADPVRVDNKVVNFSANNVRVNVVFIRKDKSPIVWNRVAIVTVGYKNNTYYKIIANSEGIENNRRHSYRLFVGIEGVAQMGLNRKATDVIVKDISEDGFSFVTDIDVENPHNMSVRLVFGDATKQFNLIGMVVRKVDVDPTKLIYGCQLTQKNQLLNQYINQKQRERLSKNSESVRQRSADMFEKQKKKIEQEEEAIKGGLMFHNPESVVNKKLNEVHKVERREIFKDNKEKWLDKN